MGSHTTCDQILADLREERHDLAAVLGDIENNYLRTLAAAPDLTPVQAELAIRLAKRLRQTLSAFDRLLGDQPAARSAPPAEIKRSGSSRHRSPVLAAARGGVTTEQL